MAEGLTVQIDALTAAAPSLLNAADSAQSAAAPVGSLTSGHPNLDAAFAAFASGWGGACADLAEAGLGLARNAVAAAMSYAEVDAMVAQAATPTTGATPALPTVPGLSPPSTQLPTIPGLN